MSDSTGFDDPVLAQRTRDAFNRLVIKVLDNERPLPQYGKVLTIDPENHTCMVQLTGDAPEDAIKVSFGGLRPTVVGQYVRVGGKRGDRFIEDVKGGAIAADNPTDSMTAPTGFDMGPTPSGVRGVWNPVDGANKYEIEFAEDAAFTVAARSYQTISNSFIESDILAGTVIYGRVRGMTSYGGTGPWSATGSTTAAFFPGGLPSDGDEPSMSPDAVATGALGFLLCEWIAVSNNDPVTYEVHISDTDGFTPDPTTLLGETSGTFFTARTDAAGDVLIQGTLYYFRIIAKDKDGSAAAGGQSIGTAMTLIGGGDVSQIPLDQVGDGSPPASTPTPVVTNGIGYLYLKWDALAALDYTVYDVHVSTVNGFTPSTATLVGGTTSDFFFIRKTGSGTGSLPLAYNTLYYVKLVARDIDGFAAASVQASGTPVQATTPDLAVGAITAGSGIIGNLAVDTAQIATAAITTAKIGLAQITTALIGSAQITNALIANAAIDSAKIQNLAVTDAKISDLSATKITAGIIAATTITIGSGGQLQGGSAPSGAGFLINDSGISLYNSSAVRTVFLNAASGSALLTGTYRTAPSGTPRMEITAGNTAHIDWFSLSSNETDNGYIYFDLLSPGSSERGRLELSSPILNGNDRALLDLISESANGSTGASATLIAGAASLSFTTAGNLQITEGAGHNIGIGSALSQMTLGHNVTIGHNLQVNGETHTVGYFTADLGGQFGSDVYIAGFLSTGASTQVAGYVDVGTNLYVHGIAQGSYYGGYAFTFFEYNGASIFFEWNGSALICFINGTGYNLSSLG